MALAGIMVFPFLFIRSTKGMKFASTLTFVSHIAFSIAIAINFVLNINENMFSKELNHYDWLPDWENLPGGYSTAVASFPVVWMAFSF